MVKRMNLRAAILILYCWICMAANAQIAPDAQHPPENAGAFTNNTVASLESLIKQKYFAVAAIPHINAALSDALKRGDYKQAKNHHELAAFLTKTLYEASHDKHLFVREVPVLNETHEKASLTRADRVRMDNCGLKTAKVLDGNVGYLQITAFHRADECAERLENAMNFLSRTDAIILDLRKNGGGSPDTAEQLLSYFFSQPNLPLFSVIPRFGEATIHRTHEHNVSFRDESRPIYVLISKSTWSAGEAVPFLLQERQRATIIGEETAGAANPASPWPINPSLAVTIPFGKVRSAIRGKNWEGTGVIPDIATSPDQAFFVAYSKSLPTLMQRTADAAKQQILAEALAKAKH